MMLLTVRPYNAIVGKEIRTRMRGWGSAVLVTIYMALFGVVALAFLMRQAAPSTAGASDIGVTLFQGLAVLQLLLILLITPASTAGAISGERQRQTWDVLRVTGLSSFGIVWGKLIAALAFNVVLIFAALPIFSLAFLFAGVSLANIVRVYVVFLATVLLLGSVSMLISAISRRLAGAVLGSNLVALILSGGLTFLAYYLDNWAVPQTFRAQPPPLTPIAQIDPLLALANALPGNGSAWNLGKLGEIHHAFGLFGTIQWWQAYAILSVVISIVLIAATTYLAGSRIRWLAGGAA